jgi:hypothetical protein
MVNYVYQDQPYAYFYLNFFLSELRSDLAFGLWPDQTIQDMRMMAARPKSKAQIVELRST